MNSQNERLLEYLKVRGSITQIEAFYELGIFRLASRISDLRRRGCDISSVMVNVFNRFSEKVRVKRYFLRVDKP